MFSNEPIFLRSGLLAQQTVNAVCLVFACGVVEHEARFVSQRGRSVVHADRGDMAQLPRAVADAHVVVGPIRVGEAHATLQEGTVDERTRRDVAVVAPVQWEAYVLPLAGVTGIVFPASPEWQVFWQD